MKKTHELLMIIMAICFIGIVIVLVNQMEKETEKNTTVIVVTPEDEIIHEEVVKEYENMTTLEILYEVTYQAVGIILNNPIIFAYMLIMISFPLSKIALNIIKQ
jgi:hypothetical protein